MLGTDVGFVVRSWRAAMIPELMVTIRNECYGRMCQASSLLGRNK